MSGAVAAGGLRARATAGQRGSLVGAGAVAGLAYYTVNATLVAGAWALDEGVAPLAAWRERFAWCLAATTSCSARWQARSSSRTRRSAGSPSR